MAKGRPQDAPTARGDDERGANVVLTELGREALRATWPVYARRIAVYFARHLSDDEARMLMDALGRVYAAAQPE